MLQVWHRTTSGHWAGRVRYKIGGDFGGQRVAHWVGSYALDPRREETPGRGLVKIALLSSFTDQYDLGCEYRGLADPASDELVVRGDLESREFTAFWLREGRVAAAMNVNMWDDGDTLGALVDGRAAVTAEQLKTAELASLV